MFNTYYQDELLYLRELGREFARANPDTARFLAEPGADPDVERLLEGVAFLTGRIRQKLDDELPEVTHALLDALFPHYLRPLPAMAVLRFEATAATQRETLRVPAGAMVESVPVAGTACRFRTAWPVELPPLRLERAEVGHSPGRLRLAFRLGEGLTCERLPLARLRLHLAGDAAAARGLLLCLGRYARDVQAQADGRTVQGLTVAPAGRAPEEALIAFPGGAASGFRTLQEYFAYPSAFCFVDLGGLAALRGLGAANAFTVDIALEHVPERLPPVSAANLLLGCTPALNLFPHEADPIPHDRRRAEYRVRPSGGDPAHYEVHSVVAVRGLVRGAREPREYRALFRGGRDGDRCGTWQERRRPALVGGGADHHLAIGDAPDADPTLPETLSVQLMCTNRQLPAQLGVGDVRLPGAQVPAGVAVRNLGVPTAAVSPVLAGDLHWRLLGHLTLNHGSLLTVDALRRLLALYDLRALVDRQAEHAQRRLLEAVLAVRAEPATRLLDGVPIRGLAIAIDLDEAGLGGPGDAWLLGAVLDEFLAQYVGLNAFTALTVRVQPGGEVHPFPARLGRRAVL